MNTLYTPHEIAKLMKVNYRKVLDEILLGRLIAFQIGRQYRVTERSLITYLNDKKVNVLSTRFSKL